MSNVTALAELKHPEAVNMPVAAVHRGANPEQWHVLKTVIHPGASDEMVCTYLDYCKARRLDPLKKPFHIVSVYDTQKRQMVETIWPSIGELRTTAIRTGEYAGKSKIEFGPTVTMELGGELQGTSKVSVTFPEWAQCSVYRMVNGQRVEFAGSPVYWLEAYASTKGGAPNSMWKKRSRGQLAKCAEAEALRSAFPEEFGSQPTAEEMEGRAIGPDHAKDITPAEPIRDVTAMITLMGIDGELVDAPILEVAATLEKMAEELEPGSPELAAWIEHNRPLVSEQEWRDIEKLLPPPPPAEPAPQLVIYDDAGEVVVKPENLKLYVQNFMNMKSQYDTAQFVENNRDKAAEVVKKLRAFRNPAADQDADAIEAVLNGELV